MSRIRRVVGQPIPADRLRVARGAVLVLAAVVAVSAFAAQSASKLLPIPEGAKRDLPQLCAAIRKEGCRTELASVDEHDLLTVVLGDLAETRPWLESLIVGLADVAPGEKRAVFKGSISSALGAPWACAELDALWENQRLRCSRD